MRFDSIPLERGMPFTQLADVLNGFSDVAFLVDQSRKLRACNEAARAIFGDVREGSDFVHVIRRPEVLRAVDAALRGQIKAQVVVELEGALRGTSRVTAARVGHLGAVVSFTDISHIREAEQMRSFINS